MLEKYNLKIPGRIFAGKGSLENIAQILKENDCSKIAVLTDKGISESGVLDKAMEYIHCSGKEIVVIDTLMPEPSVEQAQDIVDVFKASNADFIIAVGGGSVMDIAKLTSVISDEHCVRDLLNDPTKGKKNNKTLMIPTTAGTGAEATPNAIVAVTEKELKVGIVNDDMIPDYVVLDVTMIEKLPFKIAASTGLDALAHAIECYTSNKANLISDTFSLKALEMIMKNLEKACMEPDAIYEKEQMLLASFYAGVAITASGTTAVHALSYPLGGKYHIPHGISNAIMLAPVMKFNEPECRELLANAYDLIENRDVALSNEEKSQRLIVKLCDMVTKLNIPTTLESFGVSKDDLEFLVDSAMQVQRLLVNNKRTVTADDVRKLYLEVL